MPLRQCLCLGKGENRLASEKRYPIGSASIVMVFVAVCLTTFASLSLVSAKADLKLSEKTAQAVQKYYQADSLAAREVWELSSPAQMEEKGWKVCEKGWEKQFPLDERQSLQVQLRWEDGKLQIEEWRIVITKEWVGDDSLDVWVP